MNFYLSNLSHIAWENLIPSMTAVEFICDFHSYLFYKIIFKKYIMLIMILADKNKHKCCLIKCKNSSSFLRILVYFIQPKNVFLSLNQKIFHTDG